MTLGPKDKITKLFSLCTYTQRVCVYCDVGRKANAAKAPEIGQASS